MSNIKNKVGRPTDYNTGVKERMDESREMDTKRKDYIKQGINNIRGTLVQKGQKPTQGSSDRYEKMLKNLDSKYSQQLGNMANRLNSLGKYTMNAMDGMNSSISSLRKQNDVLKDGLISVQNNSKEAMAKMYKSLSKQRNDAISGNSGKQGNGNNRTTGNTGSQPYTGPDVNFSIPTMGENLNPKGTNVDVNTEATENTKSNTGPNITKDININNSQETSDRSYSTDTKFTSFLPMLQEAEGGYQNNPKDVKGNTNSKGVLVGTNRGISAPVYEAWIGHPPTAAEMKAITQETANKIFKKNFYDKIHGDLIKDRNVASTIFDHSVNAGVRGGILVAQKTLRNLGYSVKVDGKMDAGGETLRMINKVDPQTFFHAYNEERLRWYRRRSNYDEFGEGWEKRVRKFVYK